MIINSTDFKNNLGRYIKVIEKESVYVKKNNSIIAKFSKFNPYSDTEFVVQESNAAYQIVNPKMTYSEFVILNENSENRLEFINGEIYLLASPAVTHQIIHNNIVNSLNTWFKGKKCRVFSAPFDIVLNSSVPSEKNVVQPDIQVICDYLEKRDKKDKYIGIPPLVIEILSPTSRTHDVVRKFNTYLVGGVSEYWIVDNKNETILMYRFEDGNVMDMLTFKSGEKIKSIYFEGLEVLVDDVFLME